MIPKKFWQVVVKWTLCYFPRKMSTTIWTVVEGAVATM